MLARQAMQVFRSGYGPTVSITGLHFDCIKISNVVKLAKKIQILQKPCFAETWCICRTALKASISAQC